MKIRIFGGIIITIALRCTSSRSIFGSSYTLPGQREITERWIDEINRLLPG